MPREIVRDAFRSAPFAVKVGWAADRDVQVGVETDDERSLAWVLWGNDDQMRKLGATTYSAVSDIYSNAAQLSGGLPGTGDAEMELATRILNGLDVIATLPYAGVWTTLDRDGCNRLIRLLRKARDSAFGADA